MHFSDVRAWRGKFHEPAVIKKHIDRVGPGDVPSLHYYCRGAEPMDAFGRFPGALHRIHGDSRKCGSLCRVRRDDRRQREQTCLQY